MHPLNLSRCRNVTVITEWPDVNMAIRTENETPSCCGYLQLQNGRKKSRGELEMELPKKNFPVRWKRLLLPKILGWKKCLTQTSFTMVLYVANSLQQCIQKYTPNISLIPLSLSKLAELLPTSSSITLNQVTFHIYTNLKQIQLGALLGFFL